MTQAQDAIRWLCTPEAQVSAHYLIARSGRITRMVSEHARAWHAGAGSWGGCQDINSASIGIELDNDGTSPFAAPMMDALEALLGEIMTRWSLPPQAVIGHSDLAPGRKIDPGGRFDWRRLARSGLAVWPDASADLFFGTPVDPEGAPDAGRFAVDLARFGMTCAATDTVRLAAFRSRFRPQATGPLDPLDMALAHVLARDWPVDPGLGQG